MRLIWAEAAKTAARLGVCFYVTLAALLAAVPLGPLLDRRSVQNLTPSAAIVWGPVWGLVWLPFLGAAGCCLWIAWRIVHPKRGAFLAGHLLLFPLLFFALVGGGALATDVSRKQRLAADQATLQALRAAVATYHRQHGAFPERPEPYVSPRPAFQCRALTYGYDATTGRVSITSSNDASDCW